MNTQNVFAGETELRIIEYVTEEVARQGHDLATSEGQRRIEWMFGAWSWAVAESRRRLPTVQDASYLGKLIEPEKNFNGFRQCGVRVGPRICPPWQTVRALLDSLFANKERVPLNFYRDFEMIHPFVDGNGRTGKILLNWLNGTLCNPIFPPNDFWGEWIRNP